MKIKLPADVSVRRSGSGGGPDSVKDRQSVRILGLAACFLLLSLCCPGRAHAYLDPGTGSMLLSALVGIAATLFFLVKAFYYKAAGLFFRLTGASAPGPSNGDIVFYSEGSQYWNTFKPALEALDAEGQRAVYLTSDKNDPGLAQSFSHIESRHIGAGSRAFAVLNMLEADICVLTTPGLDVLQIRRSPGVRHYAHLVHSITDMAIYKLFSFDYFDSVLCSSPHQERSLRHLEQLRGTPEKLLLHTGCLYMDVLAESLETVPVESTEAAGGTPGRARRILVAPTWGGNGLLSRFGMSLLEPLAASGHDITIRPHPQSRISEAELLKSLTTRLARYPNVRWDSAPNGFQAMFDSEVLVSDLSGIVFDYAFVFERPVVTVRFEVDTRGLEAGDLPWPAWELAILPELGARIEPEEAGSLPAVIASLPGPETFREKMRLLRAQNMYNYRESGKAAARQLLEIRSALHAGRSRTVYTPPHKA